MDEGVPRAERLLLLTTPDQKEITLMPRIALVTGGQRGIGAAISEALQAAGRTVVANYAGNDAAAEAFTKRTGIRCYKFDVADYEQCADALKRIAHDVGPVEILVNN